MKDRDQELLWEAYLSEKQDNVIEETNHEDERAALKDGEKRLPDGRVVDADGKVVYTPKKKGKYDDGDGKEERCDHVPCEDADKTTVKENVGGAQLPEDLIYTALETAGSDWEGAARLIGQAISEHIINDIKYSGAGPLEDKDMAESWSYREGVKHAIEDLFAQGISDNIDDVFKAAFHSSSDGYSALDMLGYEPGDFEHEDPDQAAMDRMDAQESL